MVHARPAVLAGHPRTTPRTAAAGQVLVTIPSIGVRDLVVVGYVGSPDDLAGTLLEDTGVAASPTGPAGGVGPPPPPRLPPLFFENNTPPTHVCPPPPPPWMAWMY